MKLMHVARPTLRRVTPDADRMFERIFPEPFFGNMFEPVPTTTDWMPAIDVTETDVEYIIRLEAPGIHKENLDVKLTGDLLTITGHRERMEEKRGETELWKEREIGNFLRTMRLPAPVVEAEINATYEDGVLIIRLPKVAQAVESKISIT
jgi:HSP20 family protein